MKFAVPKFLSFTDRDGYKKAAAQVVYPITPANGPWSGSNNLGQLINFAPAANNVQSVLKLDEWGPPEMWTLSLGIEYDAFPDAGHTSGFDITADITFGAGGSTQTISCAWLNGTRLSLPMNTISVSARYSPVLLGGTPMAMTPQPNLRLSAQIARGTCVGNAVLADRFPIYLGPPDPFYTIFRIPQFAQSVELISPYGYQEATIYNANNFVLFNTSTPSSGTSIARYQCNTLKRYQMPILPAVRELQFYATAAAGNADALLLWRLAQ